MKKQSTNIPISLFIIIIPIIVILTWWSLEQKVTTNNPAKMKEIGNLKELPEIDSDFETLNINKEVVSSPVLLVKGDVKNTEKRVALHSLSVRTNIQNNIATTRFEMEFYNSENRDLEAELNFPLGQGQTISYFAMDVNGKLREGVAVEKVKARVAFETTIRQGIDPGLVEITKGNNFKARVFPVPAKGYKRIILEYLQELPANSKKAVYYLPLNYQEKLAKFNLSVVVHEQDLPPATISTKDENLEFQEVNQQFSASLSKTNFVADKSITIEIPANKTRTSVGKTKSGTYFHSTISVPKKFRTKKNPKSISVFWDVSTSRSKSDLKSEISFLASYLKRLKNVKVELIPFANTALESINFEVKNGDYSKVKTSIEALVYDGGTILESLNFEQANGSEILLFSDGLPNLGKRDFKPGKKRVYTILSASVSDASLLNYIADHTNGVFINLAIESNYQALNKISKEQLKFLGFSEQKSLKEFYPKKAFPTNGTIGVTGKIANEKASVTALFGYGNKVVFSKQLKFTGVSCSELQSKKLEKLMVIKKINLLENQYKLNKKEITDLGIKYRLVTRNTSLLVLDRLEDYLQHRIVPPLELQKEYFKHLKEIEKQEKGQKTNHLNTVKTSFNQQFNWYKKDFKRKTPKKNVSQAITNTTSNLPTQNSPTEGNVNHSTEHSEETTTEETTSETERDAIRGGTWKDVGNEEMLSIARGYNGTVSNLVSSETTTNGATFANATAASYSVSTGNSTYSWNSGSDKNSYEIVGSISVKGWDPKSPYMAKIKKASNMNQAYLIYLTEKNQYGTQPSFFLDVADYFIAKKETQKGLRILSNIAELELENHSLLRVLANKLLQLKQYSIALQLFKDLIELRPEEPQSYRDLGLAYEAMGNYNEAIKQLYHVVKEPFDSRFYGIGLIAMNEINAILSKNPEGVKIDYIDKKLLKNMPVDIRVVLNWDADNTDVDLWVTDPNGEKCYYSNNLTRAGGRISNDFTQGYGPEEFMIRRAKPGYYKIEAHYYGTTTQSIQGKATLSVQFFKQFGTRHEQKEEITRRLNVTDEVIYLGTFKF